MKIYAARHGQTQWNSVDKICGVTDIGLTEKGALQACELAAAAKEKGDINLIIASPLRRAQDTAKAVADEIGAAVITDDRITEWNYGSFEGMHRSAEGFPSAKINFGCRMRGGGESLLQLSHRVYSLLDEVIEKYPDKNVLLVCHGGVCRVIETYFNDMTTEEFLNFFMGNCELREYTINPSAE